MSLFSHPTMQKLQQHSTRWGQPPAAAPKPMAAPRTMQLARAKHSKGRSRGGTTRRAASFLDDPIAADPPRAPHPSLVNDDLLPTPASARTWAASDFAALWVTLVISITTYYLAASLVDLGMSWWQGVLTVFVGNVITLIPMTLNAHPGTKYGIPFPVLARASFGIKGANIPSLCRAAVACGWFGLQSWVGGSSIHQIVAALAPGLVAGSSPLPLLGISGPQLAAFLLFWSLQVAIIVRGIECIKQTEKASAPLLVGLAAVLMIWAVTAAGGFGPMLSAPSQFGPGQPAEGRFWSVFIPAVTANVGYWATLALSICDFSRYAVSQRAQLLGQAVGLPPFMALFSFVGLAVTSATVVIYGAPVTDPVQLLSHLKQPLAVCLSLFGLILATLTTNIAANVVAPANALVNVAPQAVSFTTGAVITAVASLFIMPWRLMTSSSFVNWLVAYSVVLGPVVGVLMADYYVVRGRQLDLDDLFSASPNGAYWYQGGYNRAALAALVAGILPCLPGLLASVGVVGDPGWLFKSVYDCAWFVGVGVSGAVYWLLMMVRAAGGAAGAGDGTAAVV